MPEAQTAPSVGRTGLLRGAFGQLLRAERPAFAFVQTMFSQALITLVNLATGVLVARLLGPDGRGIFAAVTFWPLVLAMLALAGLPYAQVYHMRGKPNASGQILGVTLLFGTILAALAALIGAIAVPSLMGQHYAPETIQVTQALVLCMTPVMLLATLVKNSFSALGQYRLANSANQADALVYLLFLLMAAGLTTLTPMLATACLYAGSIVVLGWTGWRLFRHVRPRLRGAGAEARPLASYALRASPNALLANLGLSLDRIALVSMVPQAEFGLYVVAFGLSRLVLVVQQAVASVGYPAMAGRNEASTKAVHDRLFRVIVCAMLAMVAGGWALGGLALTLLYGGEFAAAEGMFHILLIGAAVTCVQQVTMQLFLCLGRPGFTSIVQGVSFAITATALLLLVPQMGAAGAAWAVLIGSVARMLGLLMGIKLLLHMRLPGLLPGAEDWAFLKRRLRRA